MTDLTTEEKAALVKLGKLDSHHAKSTPSGGYHVVCESCDTRAIEALPDVTVVRDGYIFLEEYET